MAAVIEVCPFPSVVASLCLAIRMRFQISLPCGGLGMTGSAKEPSAPRKEDRAASHAIPFKRARPESVSPEVVKVLGERPHNERCHMPPVKPDARGAADVRAGVRT